MVMAHPFSLEGRVALITGGASGLGFAMAECMAASGAKVIIASRRLQLCEEAAQQLGHGAEARQLDINDIDAVPTFAANLVRDFGHIDILCNNAGNHCKKPIEEMSVDDFTAVLRTHVVGSFALSKALIPQMKAQGHGNIQFTASMTSFLGQPYVIGYAAAKSAFLGMIHGMATELSPAGIRVNGIAPGWIDTPMLHQAVDNDPPRKAKILGRTPMQKFGRPEDIGWAAVYLASDAASFVTGQVLVVDGGALYGF